MKPSRGSSSETNQKSHKAAVEDEVVRNANPKANENIRVRSVEPEPPAQRPSHGTGAEITDGEDG